MIYRSKDERLPDFSQEKGPAGEIFFDVRAKPIFTLNVLLMILHSILKLNLLSKDGTAALATSAFSRSGGYLLHFLHFETNFSHLNSGKLFAYGISLSVRDHS